MSVCVYVPLSFFCFITEFLVSLTLSRMLARRRIGLPRSTDDWGMSVIISLDTFTRCAGEYPYGEDPNPTKGSRSHIQWMQPRGCHL